MSGHAVCPASKSPVLLFGRSLIHNPDRIMACHFAEGYAVADIGCGPGYFLPSLSKYVGAKGKVYAIDLQQEMLDRAKKRLAKVPHHDNISFHLAREDSLCIPGKIDIALAFWMVHEVANPGRFFSEIASMMKPGGKMIMVEPKIHVSEKEFRAICAVAHESGFKVFNGVEAFFSRSAILGM